MQTVYDLMDLVEEITVYASYNSCAKRKEMLRIEKLRSPLLKLERPCTTRVAHSLL
jgi:hypothetical protein